MSPAPRSTFSTVLLASYLAACGSMSTPRDASGPPTDSSIDADASAQPDRPLLPRRGGLVQPALNEYDAAARLAAGFYELAEGDANPCTRRQAGRCEITRCRLVMRTGGFEGVTPLSAGTVAVRADGSDREIPISPDAVGLYPGVGVNDVAGTGWTSGQPLHIAALGGVVPSFAATSAVPPVITVTSPVITGSAGPALDRAAPFSVGWTPAAGSVRVLISQFAGAATGARIGDLRDGLSIDCVFDAAAGRGDVPVDALSDLATTDSYLSTVQSLVPGEVVAGDVRVAIKSTRAAVTFSGAVR